MISITRLGAVVIAAFAISACSSTPSANPDSSADTAATESVEKSAESTSVEELRAEMYAEEEVTCRYQRTVGSRLGKKVCTTESQRKAQREAGQKALERNAAIWDPETKAESGN